MKSLRFSLLPIGILDMIIEYLDWRDIKNLVFLLQLPDFRLNKYLCYLSTFQLPKKQSIQSSHFTTNLNKFYQTYMDGNWNSILNDNVLELPFIVRQSSIFQILNAVDNKTDREFILFHSLRNNWVEPCHFFITTTLYQPICDTFTCPSCTIAFKSKEYPIIIAAKNNYWTIVKELLKVDGIDPTIYEGMLLKLAFFYGQQEIILILLKSFKMQNYITFDITKVTIFKQIHKLYPGRIAIHYEWNEILELLDWKDQALLYSNSKYTWNVNSLIKYPKNVK
ncbi:hypothetical protein BC833DRAFT_611120 [Globomyces pollinis-pini]|nr:hypothetical protein BC833DRAFT_611120 [Globomyces pollinis-pini]